MRVPALAGEMQPRLRGIVLVAREVHTAIDQPFDAGGSAVHGEANRRFVAQAGAGDEGVLDMRLQRVGFVENRGNAALSPQSGAAFQWSLGHQSDTMAEVGQAQGKRQPGSAAAEDQDFRRLRSLIHFRFGRHTHRLVKLRALAVAGGWMCGKASVTIPTYARVPGRAGRRAILDAAMRRR